MDCTAPVLLLLLLGSCVKNGCADCEKGEEEEGLCSKASADETTATISVCTLDRNMIKLLLNAHVYISGGFKLVFRF